MPFAVQAVGSSTVGDDSAISAIAWIESLFPGAAQVIACAAEYLPEEFASLAVIAIAVLAMYKEFLPAPCVGSMLDGHQTAAAEELNDGECVVTSAAGGMADGYLSTHLQEACNGGSRHATANFANSRSGNMSSSQSGTGCGVPKSRPLSSVLPAHSRKPPTWPSVSSQPPECRSTCVCVIACAPRLAHHV